MLKNLQEKFYWQLPAWICAGFILTLTSLPDLKPPSLGLRLEDKIYHLLVYGILGVLIVRARVRGRPAFEGADLRALFRIGIPLACLDELHQAFIPGRFCDGFDALADLLGLLLAALVWRIFGETLSRADRSIYCNLIKCDASPP
ncbi:MAG TPA: VanZ family protein [bacterium]|nr:VanZ family protein [bacterium]HQG45317.1 VanZ family protein [bacterium]HQI49065.1 VanZ family protein [bacterium]HQJ63487.1 VanZ family protein [bacterium]